MGLCDLPDALVGCVLGWLDPGVLAALDVAGGGFGRCARAATKQWAQSLERHAWLLGPHLPPGATLKGHALKQWAKGRPGALHRTGHVLLVGGNTDRSITHAEEPVASAILVRDCPSLHHLPLDQLLAREAAAAPLRGRPMYRPIADLNRVRSAYPFKTVAGVLACIDFVDIAEGGLRGASPCFTGRSLPETNWAMFRARLFRDGRRAPQMRRCDGRRTALCSSLGAGTAVAAWQASSASAATRRRV
jgi:hypothetical protein